MADPRRYLLQQENDLRRTTPAERPPMHKYYKDPSYFAKNLAPEQIPDESLRALAKAAALAVKNGILSPGLADKFLSNALVEGHTGGAATETFDAGNTRSGRREEAGGYVPQTGTSFGVASLGYDGPDVRHNLAKMGLTVAAGNEPDGYSNLWAFSPEGQFREFMPAKTNDAFANARLAAVILGKKAALHGEDKAIERWNGTGPNATRHAQRVEMMQQMLQHPSNRALLDAYNNYRDEP